MLQCLQCKGGWGGGWRWHGRWPHWWHEDAPIVWWTFHHDGTSGFWGAGGWDDTGAVQRVMTNDDNGRLVRENGQGPPWAYAHWHAWAYELPQGLWLCGTWGEECDTVANGVLWGACSMFWTWNGGLGCKSANQDVIASYSIGGHCSGGREEKGWQQAHCTGWIGEAVAMTRQMAFCKGDGNDQGDGNIKQRRNKDPDVATAVPRRQSPQQRSRHQRGSVAAFAATMTCGERNKDVRQADGEVENCKKKAALEGQQMMRSRGWRSNTMLRSSSMALHVWCWHWCPRLTLHNRLGACLTAGQCRTKMSARRLPPLTNYGKGVNQLQQQWPWQGVVPLWLWPKRDGSSQDNVA